MFPNFTLTIKGEELLNKAIGERKIIKFTVFKLGKGDILENEDIREVEDVKDIFKTIPVLDTQVLSNQMLKLKGYFDNKGLSEDTLWKEIGVFAQLGEDSLTEIMYSYTNAGNEGTLIPSETRSQSFRRTLDIRNYIGYATDITFNITELRDKYAFNTLREMQVATFLREGDKIELWGNENLGDISLKFYIVESENNEGILLENGLYANIYEDMAKKQNETENRLLTAAKTIWESINELFTKKANKDDVENNLITVDEGKILDARQGPAIVNKINGLAGGYSGAFPLTTAVKEGIYLLPATNKFYVCIENYNGSSLTAPNANFEELSVFQNRNKLENLGKVTLLYKSSTNRQVIGSIPLTDYISSFKIIILICGNSLGNPKIDLFNFSYYVETLIFNDEATTDNQPGDYSLIFHDVSGFGTCYFRKNKKEIYLFNSRGNDPTLYAVYGIY